MNWMPKREELFKGEEYYRKQLKKQESWDVFKQSYLNNTLNYVSSKPKPMIFWINQSDPYTSFKLNINALKP